jgi:hypothetical protein
MLDPTPAPEEKPTALFFNTSDGGFVARYSDELDDAERDAYDELHVALAAVTAAKLALLRAEVDVKEATERSLKLIERAGLPDGFRLYDRWFRVTRSTQSTFNLAKLQRLIGHELYAKVTASKIDRKAYATQRALGTISDGVDAAVVTTTPKAPYINLGRDPRVGKEDS